jgi:hypothetical protein
MANRAAVVPAIGPFLVRGSLNEGSRPAALAARTATSAQSLVEFDLALPLFVTVMMVAFQRLWLFMAQLVVMWGVQDNARHAATSTAGVGNN